LILVEERLNSTEHMLQQLIAGLGKITDQQQLNAVAKSLFSSSAPRLCPGRTDFEDFNCLLISLLPVTDTGFGPMHKYIITE
jgi:hypothetical protein